MANFWDNLNNQAAQRASQGAPQSWDEYSKMLAAQTPQPTKKKGFWADQISTGGSIGGALAGGAAGTAILPGVGTLIGALLGGAAGGAGGQVAENKITGEQDLMKDVGTEALWGGATTLPFGAGLKLAKAGGTLAKGLGSTTARQGAMNLVQEAGIKTMGKKALGNATLAGTLSEGAQSAAERLAKAPTLTQKLGGKLSGTADDFAVKQFRLNPGQTSAFRKVHGEDAGKVIRRYGIDSAEDVAAKGIEPLQGAFDAVIKDIPDISAKELDSGLRSIYEPLTKSPALFQQQLGAQLKGQADELMKFAGNGTLPASKVNELRRTFDSAVKYTQRGAPEANVAKETADALRGLLQKTADKAGIKSADGKTFKEIGAELSKMYQLDEIIGRQGELGRGSLPLNIPNLIGGAIGGGTGGIPGMVAGGVITNAVNSPGGRKLAMGAVDKATSILNKSVPKEAGQTLAQVMTRMGGIGAGRSMLGSDQSSFENSAIAPKNTTDSMNMPTTSSMGQSSDLNNTDVAAMMSSATTTPSTSNIGSQYTQPEQPSSPLGYSSTQIASALMQALAAGDTASAKQLSQMYELASTFESSGASDLSQSSRSALASSDNAINTVNQLEEMFNAAGGGGGRIGGAIKSFAGDAGFNEGAKVYDSMANASVTQIAKALAGAGGGTVSDMDAKVIMSALARFNDNPDEARAKFAALRNRLENAKYNTMLYGGGSDASSLEAALAQR